VLNFALARYNVDATLDSTFGNGGKVSTSFPGEFSFVDGLALQPDGKIICGQVDVERHVRACPLQRRWQP
jgi:hypothetical protein